MADDDVMSAVRVAGTLVIGLVVLLVFFLWRAGGVYEWEAKSPEVQKAVGEKVAVAYLSICLINISV